jgi:hypothetical protein
MARKCAIRCGLGLRLTILFPLKELSALLYVLIPIRAGYIPAGFNTVLRTIQRVRPWKMIEVFMLAVLVAIVKMLNLARVIPEFAFFCFRRADDHTRDSRKVRFASLVGTRRQAEHR